MKRTFAFCAALCVLLLALTACGKSGLTADEIRTLCEDLVEESYSLNDVYYGDGLPYEEDEAVLEELLGVGAGSLSLSYLPVAADAPLKSEDEIRAATEKVFSPEMCAMLYEIAFSGVSTEDESKVAFARYIQQGDYLTVRVDLKESAVDVGRTYNFDEMTVLVDEANRIRVELPSEVDGKKSVNVKITLVKTADGWRLDSPTY